MFLKITMYWKCECLLLVVLHVLYSFVSLWGHPVSLRSNVGCEKVSMGLFISFKSTHLFYQQTHQTSEPVMVHLYSFCLLMFNHIKSFKHLTRHGGITPVQMKTSHQCNKLDFFPFLSLFFQFLSKLIPEPKPFPHHALVMWCRQ